jgi:hypothetical protein
MQSSNILNNPATRKNQPMQHVRQSSAKRTLGVICCPDGYGKAQICHSLQKAREFIGKFRNSSLSCHSKWVAVESVVSPAILFPLANTFYSKSDIQPVEAIISRLWCAAFFLGYPAWTNVSGRERDPVSKTKEAKNRINDILNNICHPSMISKKIEIKNLRCLERNGAVWGICDWHMVLHRLHPHWPTMMFPWWRLLFWYIMIKGQL